MLRATGGIAGTREEFDLEQIQGWEMNLGIMSGPRDQAWGRSMGKTWPTPRYGVAMAWAEGGHAWVFGGYAERCAALAQPDGVHRVCSGHLGQS